MTHSKALAAKSDARLVMLSMACSYLAFRINLPFFPFFLQELGITDLRSIALWSGLLYSTPPFLSGLLAPVWGSLADRYGVRRIGILMLLNSTILLLAMAFVTDVHQLLALRIGVGLLSGYGTIAPAIVAQIVSEERLGSAIGTLHALRTGTTAVGPIIGAFVLAAYGPRATLLVSALVVLLSMVLLMIFFKDAGGRTRPDAETGWLKGIFHPVRAIFQLPLARNLLIIVFVAQLVVQSLEVMMPILISVFEELNSAAQTTGLILALGAIAGATSAVMLGRFMRRLSPFRLLRVSSILAASLCLCLVLVSTVPFIGLFYVLFNLAAGGIATVAMAWGGKTMPQAIRATAFSIFGSAIVFSSSFGPLLAGVLIGIDMRLVFLLGAVLLCLLFLWMQKSLAPAPAIGQAGATD